MNDAEDECPPQESTQPTPRPRRRHRRVIRPATNADTKASEGQSQDDLPEPGEPREDGPDRDQWLRAQRPPHWE